MAKMPVFHCFDCDRDKAACLFNQAQHSKTEGSRICMECQRVANEKYRVRGGESWFGSRVFYEEARELDKKAERQR